MQTANECKLEDKVERYPRSAASGRLIIDLDDGARLTGTNYEAAKASMEPKVNNVIHAWGGSLGQSKVSVNGHDFEWNMGDGTNSYELVYRSNPDRLIAKGRGKKAMADARNKLQELYEEDRDLFYTIMIAMMTSGKVVPHFCEIPGH